MLIEIDYNTVSFESKILCNDETIQKNLKQTFSDTRGKRITEWFETFIFRIKEEINNDQFSIEVKGCDHYEQKFIDSILDKESDFILEKKIEIVDEKWVNKKYNDIDSFLNYTLCSKEDIVRKAIQPNVPDIKSLKSNKVEVPIIATMSSGKSTLLNALIGQDFLYEDTGAATATTCNIKVNNELKDFTAQAIDDDTIIDETTKDLGEFLERWNSSANKTNYPNLKLNIEGPVKNINSSELELNFIDTPGPNSAQFSNHTEKTYNYLKDNKNLPIVLYVLDPEKMDSKDDDNTLREISEVLNSNKQNLERIIFIYNKVDRENLDQKPFIEILPKIKKFLGKYNIHDPKVFPVCAKYSKLAQLNEDLSRNDKHDLTGFRYKFKPSPKDGYDGYQLLENAPLTSGQKQILEKEISKSELDADLVYSGLASIKLYLEDYISNHHQKNQYRDLMGIAYKVMESIQSNLNLKKENLEEKTAQEQKKRRERNQLEREELSKRKSEALQEINNIEVDKKFIQDAFKKMDKDFTKITDKSIRKSELSPSEAKKLVEELNATISNLRISIKTDLVSRINDESSKYLQELKKEVVRKFELPNPSLETKTFNADLLNKINVLDIKKIDSYKRIDIENKEKQVEVEVKSKKWYKRLFGLTDTEIRTKIYQTKKEIIEYEKFQVDVVFPLLKQFTKMIEDCRSGFDDLLLSYKNSFIKLVNISFEDAIKSVYANSDKEMALTNQEKEIEFQKLDDIKKSISKFKIQELHEKIYRKPAVAC
jgi:hypothetical protein